MDIRLFLRVVFKYKKPEKGYAFRDWLRALAAAPLDSGCDEALWFAHHSVQRLERIRARQKQEAWKNWARDAVEEEHMRPAHRFVRPEQPPPLVDSYGIGDSLANSTKNWGSIWGRGGEAE